MGQPDDSDIITTPSVGQTRGTETSHYPEEKKTKVIPQVVASERGAAQTVEIRGLGPRRVMRLIRRTV